MAIHNEGVIQHSGNAKELDAGALDMILDNLQISQYVFPVKSTIRELASNGVDSVREKNTAIEILTGVAKVEDYYYVPGNDKAMDEAILANPGVYKDSKFDPLYYNLDYLSPDNKVYITYKQNGTKSKDTLTIRDNGVGLGDYRLHGYLKIGYSTKRLSKRPLGKWGLGAKAPLSMGVPYYEMISVHNGRKFKFLVYSRHWEPSVPEATTKAEEDGSLTKVVNDYIYFYNDDGSIVQDQDGNDRKIYFEYTNELNYTETIVDCKKHYITDIRNAVQSQLLYFDNVEFSIINEANEVEEVPVQAPILYQDDFLILSDNNQFSKPHIVINNVSYGYVNFEELELEQSQGNIGIKVVSGEIDVTPNRENVIWNDTTREVILKRFKQASRAAKKIIMESFQQEDFKEWLGACAGVFGYGSALNGAIPGVRALIQLQNIAKVKGTTHPEFKPDPRIRYSGFIPNMFPGMKVRLVTKKWVQRKKESVEDILRSSTESVADLFNYPIYLQDMPAQRKRDEYLLSLHPDGFLLIRNPLIKDTFVDETEDTTEIEAEAEDTTLDATELELLKEIKNGKYKVQNDANVTIPLMLDGVLSYKAVNIPETESEVDEIPKETAEERRRREQRIVVTTGRSDGRWQKVEPTVHVLSELDKEFYWGNNDDKELLTWANSVIRPIPASNKAYNSRINELYSISNPDHDKIVDYWKQVGFNDTWDYYVAQTYWADPQAKVLFGIVNKDNIRYVQDEHFHITEFFNRFQDGVLTMADALITWNTARILKENLDKISFMHNMHLFNKPRHDQFLELQTYVAKYYSRANDSSIETAVIGHLDKVQQLQVAFRDAGGKDGNYIISLIEELFGEESAKAGITGAHAVDLGIIDKMNDLLVWVAPISAMLSLVEDMDRSLYFRPTQEQEEAIRQYIEWRTQ